MASYVIHYWPPILCYTESKSSSKQQLLPSPQYWATTKPLSPLLCYTKQQGLLKPASCHGSWVVLVYHMVSRAHLLGMAAWVPRRVCLCPALPLQRVLCLHEDIDGLSTQGRDLALHCSNLPGHGKILRTDLRKHMNQRRLHRITI